LKKQDKISEDKNKNYNQDLKMKLPKLKTTEIWNLKKHLRDMLNRKINSKKNIPKWLKIMKEDFNNKVKTIDNSKKELKANIKTK
jgi:hypothetical protein